MSWKFLNFFTSTDCFPIIPEHFFVGTDFYSVCLPTAKVSPVLIRAMKVLCRHEELFCLCFIFSTRSHHKRPECHSDCFIKMITFLGRQTGRSLPSLWFHSNTSQKAVLFKERWKKVFSHTALRNSIFQFTTGAQAQRNPQASVKVLGHGR